MCSVNGALKLIYSANTQMSLKYQAFLHSLLDFNTSRLVLSEFMERGFLDNRRLSIFLASSQMLFFIFFYQPQISHASIFTDPHLTAFQDFMMELTSHQSDVGAVLEFGNQLISEGLVSEKEENEIREQMISLNDRWEALRMAAMDRQTKYVRNLSFLHLHLKL